MAECILERTNNPVPPPDDDMLPSWCKCGNCVLMETEEENVCCNKTTCIIITVKNDLLKIRKNLLTPTSAKMLLFQDVFLLILVRPTTN